MPEARPKFNQHSLLVILKMHLGQLTIMRGYIPPIQSFQICFRRFFQGCRIRSNRKTVRSSLDSHNSLSCSWSGSGTGAYCLDIRNHVSHNFGGLIFMHFPEQFAWDSQELRNVIMAEVLG